MIAQKFEVKVDMIAELKSIISTHELEEKIIP